jgi:asparagine synthase (glutamine-hydrolysing)
MFRYIGLVWDASVASHGAAAAELSEALQLQPDWKAVLLRPGLHVFAAGLRPGINEASALPSNQGVVLGKLFRRADLLSAGVSHGQTLTADEATRLRCEGGMTLVRDFWGRYVAFIRTDSGGTRIVRDPGGALPCHLLHHRGVDIAFSWLEDLFVHLPQITPPGIDWDATAAHVLLGALGGRKTALKGVTQVLPGEVVELGCIGRRRELLWNGVEVARAPTDLAPDDACSQLRSTVRACAQAWAGCHDSVLLRLSGGVDSSILAVCLAQGSRGTRVTCVNYHSPGASSDERQYARLAAARAQHELVERPREGSFRLEAALQAARTPTPESYIGRTSARVDAELAAAHGATALFTGGGGDQLFFESRQWWPIADYLRVRGMDKGFPSAAMSAARLGGVSVWKAIRLALGESLRHAHAAPEAGQHLSLISRENQPSLRRDGDYFHPALLDESSLPIGKLAQTRQLMSPAGYYDPFEREAAPELVNPLLSQPLVELCLRLPTFVLTHGGRGRGLARQAFAAELPAEIAHRRTKGGMEEHIQAILMQNLDFARTLLLDGELVSRGILDRVKVEHALRGRPAPLASLVGEIHFYIGIEAWLQRSAHRPAPGATR